MYLTLGKILKNSNYKLTQFDQNKIENLEKNIIVKEINGKFVPYMICLIRNKEIKLLPR